MFMSTRYRKKDPEWRKKSLFNVEDSLANLLECLSIEYRYFEFFSTTKCFAAHCNRLLLEVRDSLENFS